jgi:hypothetical protein
MSHSPYSQIIAVNEIAGTTWVNFEDTYSYNKQGRLPWLQRSLFKVLSQLNCKAGYEKLTLSAVHFTTHDLVDLIMKQQYIVWQIHQKQIKYVLVGRDHYEKLVKGSTYMTHFMFEFPPYRTYGSNRVDFSGLRVVFIPWMEGIIAIPELP